MISFKLFYESFDTVSQFLTNPEYRNKSFDQMIEDFQNSGGQVLGKGSYGTAFYHPSWPYIIKVFIKDDPYVKFVRFVYNNPHPAFPKFYGKPQRIIPDYARDPRESKLYIVRLEKLQKMKDHAMYEYLQDSMHIYSEFRSYESLIKSPEFNQDKNIIDGFQKYSNLVAHFSKQVRLFCEGWFDLHMAKYNEDWPYEEDWHIGNVMIRDDGQYVMIDPLWAPYNSEDIKRGDYSVKTTYNPLGILRKYYVVGGKLPSPKIKKLAGV